MTIILAILLFSLLIFVHELGHFLAAKASGVRVNEFAMFMGPAIFKKQVGDTLYSLRCIPSVVTALWKGKTRTQTIRIPSKKQPGGSGLLSWLPALL